MHELYERIWIARDEWVRDHHGTSDVEVAVDERTARALHAIAEAEILKQGGSRLEPLPDRLPVGYHLGHLFGLPVNYWPIDEPFKVRRAWDGHWTRDLLPLPGAAHGDYARSAHKIRDIGQRHSGEVRVIAPESERVALTADPDDRSVTIRQTSLLDRRLAGSLDHRFGAYTWRAWTDDEGRAVADTVVEWEPNPLAPGFGAWWRKPIPVR